MVHLTTIPNDSTVNAPIVDGMDKLSLDKEDEFTSSVYGSRFACEDLPQYEMPEGEMPKEVAYRMIKYYDACGNSPAPELCADQRLKG